MEQKSLNSACSSVQDSALFGDTLDGDAAPGGDMIKAAGGISLLASPATSFMRVRAFCRPNWSICLP